MPANDWCECSREYCLSLDFSDKRTLGLTSRLAELLRSTDLHKSWHGWHRDLAFCDGCIWNRQGHRLRHLPGICRRFARSTAEPPLDKCRNGYRDVYHRHIWEGRASYQGKTCQLIPSKSTWNKRTDILSRSRLSDMSLLHASIFGQRE